MAGPLGRRLFALLALVILGQFLELDFRDNPVVHSAGVDLVAVGDLGQHPLGLHVDHVVSPVSDSGYLASPLDAVNISFISVCMKSTRKCPICNGDGRIELGIHADDSPRARRIMARALRAQGYSFRQIAKLCGWKSPRSAVMAVESKDDA